MFLFRDYCLIDSNQVCRACARRCHHNHAVEASFVKWDPHKDKCGCAVSGRCRAIWSQNRLVFDRMVDHLTPASVSRHRGNTWEEVLHMRDFRTLLEILHPNNLSEDDIDSGEVALHSSRGTISWFDFEKWHNPYFEVSGPAQDFFQCVSCAFTPGEEKGGRPRDQPNVTIGN